MMARSTARSWGCTAVAAALQLVLAAAPAMAADTRWIGGAGPDAPFWDLAANWSAGWPAAADTDVLLGASNTTLRRGSFLARQLEGTGALQMSGAALDLRGPSSVGGLELSSGRLAGHSASLSVGRLQWTGGVLGYAGQWSDQPFEVRVQGPAVLAGRTLQVEYGTRLHLDGATLWQDGASALEPASIFSVGTGAVFHDDANSADHVLGRSGLDLMTVEGRYVKTGAATTSVGHTRRFENLGTLEVLGGHWRSVGLVDASWRNQGLLRVENARAEVSVESASFLQEGRVEALRGGTLAVRHERGRLLSTGAWHIAEGGRVEIRSAQKYGETFEARFSTGLIDNAGTLRFSEGEARLQKDVELRGPGTLELARGAQLKVEGDLRIARLRIGESRPSDEGAAGVSRFSSLVVQGQVVLDRLEWGVGRLELSGPLTVKGQAVLSGDDPRSWTYYDEPPPHKEIRTAAAFLGGVIWDGSADVFGSGSIRVAAGTRFEDRNARGTRDVESLPLRPRPTRVAVSSFRNEGTYVKTGAGQTVVESAFENLGVVKLVKAAPLTFAGALDNRGVLEVDRSRLMIWGPLAQWKEGGLAAGDYVVRNGTLALNLGSVPDGTRPTAIATNKGRIVLDGPQARIATFWQGSDHNALGESLLNAGELALLNGASLQSGWMQNIGRLQVDEGSVLKTDGYTQRGDPGSEARPATWLAGTLDPWSADIFEGDFSAGAEGQVGEATLLGRLSFGSSRLLLDVDSSAVFDHVRVAGIATLDGLLWADFDTPALAPGVYRFLTADGGVYGQFATLGSNLDTSHFQLAVNYGPNYVELVVSTAPEPGSWALSAGGLVMLCGCLRRRRMQWASVLPCSGLHLKENPGA
ncbi:hypothetical protein OOT46_10690 [Aquabacterium sp. A7-Y]|uniref:hypothetical protein n=1 Tax=Aquabacterium sp. A7-Y TaxID=1349605 RepID=UPI00223D5940|nr:hypothetical protein [Aquabacterium sp. A7-Y]MCW7538308.1 hypothetical protein [Aquabacterium sp. A7-Y]